MYHGLRFDPTGVGVGVEIRGQQRILAAARVKAYPAGQRTRFIWVWTGDRAKADENLIPDTYSIQHPAWATKPGCMIALRESYSEWRLRAVFASTASG